LRPYREKLFTKRAGEEAQGVDPKFKSQYRKHAQKEVGAETYFHVAGDSI
jgi:hypothetical protein